jgi:hypothetical protein
MAQNPTERLSVVPPRQYDEGVELKASEIEHRRRPNDFALYANKLLQSMDLVVLTEVLDYATEFEPMMSKNPVGRNVSLARLILRAAMQTENDIARKAHKKLPYKMSS